MVVLLAGGVQADQFGAGANQFTMDFKTIGHAGNQANVAQAQFGVSRGAVGRNYGIGKHEVTVGQFNKASASDSKITDSGRVHDPHNLGSMGAASKITFYEATKFANWLTSGDAHKGAYLYSPTGVYQGVNRAAAIATYGNTYVLPTVDEWYKAAFFKSDGSGYTFHSNGKATLNTTDVNFRGSPPPGGLNHWAPWTVGSGAIENNGTYDMVGNVQEWTETPGGTSYHQMMGGAYTSPNNAGFLNSEFLGNAIGTAPLRHDSNKGFRIVAIPEPTAIAFIGLFAGGLIFIRRTFMM